LTPDQSTKLRATQERFGTRRRALMQQQIERRRAIDDQMQPGVPANADSLRKLMDGVQAGRAEMVKIEQEEQTQLDVLKKKRDALEKEIVGDAFDDDKPKKKP